MRQCSPPPSGLTDPATLAKAEAEDEELLRRLQARRPDLLSREARELLEKQQEGPDRLKKS